MTDPTSLQIAVVGAGYFAQLHLDSWQRMPGATLQAVCDQDLSRAKAPGLPAFTDLDAMLQEVQPDLLDIVLPPKAHAQAINTALNAGVPTIICQKPFTTSRAEAHLLTERAEARGATLIIHENFRFQPWYRAIAQALDAGQIGEVQQATFRFRPGDGQGPGAYLARQPYFQKMPRFMIHETGVHWVDTFRFLFGPPKAVYADLHRLNPAIAGEDAGHVIFHHPGGVRALFDGNRHLDHAATNPRCTMGEALIEGTDGAITLTGDGRVALRRHGALETRELLAHTQTLTFGGDCVHHLNTHVIKHLTCGAPLENTARAYLPVIDIEEAIYASAQRRAMVDLPC